ncbi:glutathione synthetase [Nitrosococcus halophilus Nc 4]|uniref:Glutathione synthetase n=1 Tax=Nitrosococcus halophilus (strain Nc4) TaxID=472759 RepID=D5BUL9_NITHN|nr:glutathione synthase [Nitrosococcus halophilus]ADE13419.1 glutathione synthetase [Nitrosococcus halophilus Nc 4]
MTIRLGVVMDPIATLNIKKDSTFAMLLEAQSRGWTLGYMEQSELYLKDGHAYALLRELMVKDDPASWYQLGQPHPVSLTELDLILMRKDPPFDMEYVYTTYLLERAEQAGVLVVNKPSSLRDANEKLYTAWFPQCCPPTLVTRKATLLRDFLAEQQDIVLKPLDTMGGASIFRVRQEDPNLAVIIETLTHQGQRQVMAQRYLPEIRFGDKRILMVDGQPIPYALARIPAPGETRGNLAAGGRGEGIPLSARDYWICEQVGPTLKARGLIFVGLDVIGDYLTEINVTSPTCIRELDALYGLNISAQLMDCLASRLAPQARA